MVGMPGVGKTHFAEQFSETFCAPLVSAHQLEKLSTDTNAIHAVLLNQLKQALKTKQTVVFEGPTDRRVERMELAKLAREFGYKVLFVWVQTDQVTAKQRALKQMDSEKYEQYSKRFSAPHDSEQYVVISGRHTYSTQAKTLLKRLTRARASASDTSPNAVVPQRQSVGRIHIG